ncbi:MAG: hypothetical protein MJ239_05715 [Bacilli bacterium]|nr:hypothetical protein [Bacilli bacterium]
MIEDKNGRLRIGRVTKDVERGLNLSLTGDTKIYIEEKTLNDMAISFPAKYLRILEEIEAIIKEADWVSFFDDNETLLYIKEYIHNKRFEKFAVSIRYKGTPKLLCFERFWKVEEEELLFFLERSSFVHPKK